MTTTASEHDLSQTARLATTGDVGAIPTARQNFWEEGDTLTDLIIDNEFKELLPPLSDEKYKQLEKNLLRDGIREPLTVWNGILIDGHNRYNIARLHNLEFTTVEKQFDTRDDVKLWIADNQFGRRDLTTYERSVLALKLKPVFAAKAKENLVAGAEMTNTGLQKSVKAINTQQEIAKAAGVSHDTIAKVERIEQQATPEIKQALRNFDKNS